MTTNVLKTNAGYIGTVQQAGLCVATTLRPYRNRNAARVAALSILRTI